MVSVIPPKRTPFHGIAEAMSEFGRNAPQLLEERFQKQRGLSAIDDLENALKAGVVNEKGERRDLTPQEMVSKLAKAYTLNPSLERSGLGQTFLQQTQRADIANKFPLQPGGKENTSPQEAQQPVSFKDLVPPRPSMIQNPQGLQEFQLPYGPDEIAKTRQEARRRNYTPEIEERLVNDMKEYNQAAAQRREYEIQNYTQQQQQRRDTQENQKLFGNYLQNNAKELWDNPDDRELALKASDRLLSNPLEKNASFADVLSKVKNELRPYQAARESLKKTLERPLFGQTNDQRELASRRAKMMVDMGQKPMLQLMIANGGHGDVEEARLLNPLPQDVEKSLSKIQPFKNPLEMVKSIEPDSEQFHAQLEKGRKIRDAQEKFASDFLAKTISPGKSYDEPGTNLILTRKALMDKGASWEEAGKIIDKAIVEGKINLDPQQMIDHQKLGYPPLTGDSYLDTVMNNLMFPITGKE